MAGESSPAHRASTGSRSGSTSDEQVDVVGRGDVLARVHDPIALEGVDDAAQVLDGDVVAEHREDGRLQELLDDQLVASLLDGLDLELAGGGRGQGVEVGDAGHHVGLAVDEGAARGVGDEGLEVRDGEPDRHARALVDVGAAPGELRQLGHDLGHVRGHHDLDPGRLERTGLLQGDGDLGLDVERVVGADLGAEAVLQRSDDPAAVRVVLGVGRGEEHDVERQPDLVAPDLDVALLEHVEQADLDALGEVGQLVDGEDAAVGAGHQPVVERELVGEVPALGDLDGIDLTDEVGDRGVGGGELLAEAVVAVDPVDGGVVAELGDEVTGVLRHRVVGVVVDLRPGHDRHPLVEQAGQGADHPGLRLTPLAEEDDVVTRQQCVLELRQDGVLVAEHVGEQRLTRLDALDGIPADLFLDRTALPTGRP